MTKTANDQIIGALVAGTSAVRRLLADPTVRERMERAAERGGMDAAVAELDALIVAQQDAYLGLPG